MRHRHRLAAIVLVLTLLVSATVRAQDSQTLTVFAAASLNDAFEEIATNFEAENSGVDVVFNFGGSSTLAAQLAEGAPADVFASANNRQMQAAQDAGRISNRPRTFVKNRLVLVVPVDNPAQILSLRDLAAPGIKLVIAAPDVPVRDYTNTMLERLAADPGYGEAYRETFMANVVSEEDNVRQVAAKVALGEADAGIVYRSDVTPDISDQVISIPIPDLLNTIATYPIAVTDNPANAELAQSFVDYVLSDAGQDTLVKWNFISSRIPAQPATITPGTSGQPTVDGQVLNPLTLSREILQRDFTSQIIDVTYRSGEDTVSATFTGVPLWSIISAAQPNLNADRSNDKLSMFIVVTGSDGYQAVIAWGEIDPEFGAQPILLAYQQDGEPIGETGTLRLVVPGDGRGGRYVSDVVNISLRDAPPAA